MARVIYLFLISFLLMSCAVSPAITSALPASFSTQNIMTVHQGMRSEDILELFGEPNSIKTAVCGAGSSQWNCTTWEYGDFPYDRASFTFSGSHGALILNNFSVERERAW